MNPDKDDPRIHESRPETALPGTPAAVVPEGKPGAGETTLNRTAARLGDFQGQSHAASSPGIVPASMNLDYRTAASPNGAPKPNDARLTTIFSSDSAMISNVAEPTAAAASFLDLSEQLEKDLVQIFKLLSDETRLRVLLYLARERELHVTALCEKLGQSQPAVSHHLALLRVAGLIEARRDGKHNYYSVKTRRFNEIMQQLFRTLTTHEADAIRFDEFVVTYDAED
jgi:ArsR family transcriptional regulator